MAHGTALAPAHTHTHTHTHLGIKYVVNGTWHLLQGLGEQIIQQAQENRGVICCEFACACVHTIVFCVCVCV